MIPWHGVVCCQHAVLGNPQLNTTRDPGPRVTSLSFGAEVTDDEDYRVTSPAPRSEDKRCEGADDGSSKENGSNRGGRRPGAGGSLVAPGQAHALPQGGSAPAAMRREYQKRLTHDKTVADAEETQRVGCALTGPQDSCVLLGTSGRDILPCALPRGSDR